MLVAGIDAGQSSTHAVIADASLAILGRGEAGPADEVDEPPSSRRCADACERAVTAAFTAAGLDPATPLHAVVIGLSGYEGTLRGERPQFGAARVEIVHDAPIALAGAIERRPGVVVIAGTGSVAYGEGVDGAHVRVGGYGFVFGDDGSAFALARTALARALVAYDAGGTSRIGDAAPPFFNLPDLPSIAAGFYARTITRAAVASFARVVIDAARLGDAHADALLEDAAQALALLAAIAIQRLETGPATVPVAFIGGMMANDDFHARAAHALRALAPTARAVAAQADPATGAARMALALR
jgi:N-acetylglucosamine kinase-like BadF-type ATPase